MNHLKAAGTTQLDWVVDANVAAHLNDQEESRGYVFCGGKGVEIS